MQAPLYNVISIQILNELHYTITEGFLYQFDLWDVISAWNQSNLAWRRQALDHFLNCPCSVHILRNANQIWSYSFDNQVSLLVIAVLKKLLAKVVSKRIWNWSVLRNFFSNLSSIRWCDHILQRKWFRPPGDLAPPIFFAEIGIPVDPSILGISFQQADRSCCNIVLELAERVHLDWCCHYSLGLCSLMERWEELGSEALDLIENNCKVVILPVTFSGFVVAWDTTGWGNCCTGAACWSCCSCNWSCWICGCACGCGGCGCDCGCAWGGGTLIRLNFPLLLFFSFPLLCISYHISFFKFRFTTVSESFCTAGTAFVACE